MNLNNENFTYKIIEDMPLYRHFHINTSLDSEEAEKFLNNIDIIKKEKDFLDNSKNIFREDSEEDLIVLPCPSKCVKKNILDVLKHRITNRKFVEGILDIRVFSDVMYFSFGLRKNEKNSDHFFYPGAGGFNSLRIYVYVNSINTIKKGLYIYNPSIHAIKLVSNNENIKYESITASFNLATNCCFSLYLVGDMMFIGYKYGDRAYRFMNLEAGHAMQNLYLMVTASSLGCVASGGFYDLDFLEYFGINSPNLYLLYESFVGSIEKNRIQE